jgi:hypothetical protein
MGISFLNQPTSMTPNKQLQRTVTRRRGRLVTRPLNCGVRRHFEGVPVKVSYLVRAIAALALGVSAALWAQPTGESAAYIHVVSFRGSAYHVNIRGTKVLYRTSPAGAEVATQWETIEVSASAVDNYFKGLREIGVFSWRNEYLCNVMDGTAWEVEVLQDSYHFSRGSNHFPPRFDELLRLTSQLVSRPFDADISACEAPL